MRSLSILRVYFALLLSMLLMASCASTPEFDLTNVDQSLTPVAVTTDLDTAQHLKIVWGGVVISSENLKSSTRIEVLAYPLDSNHMPLLSKEPLGRFFINHDGYLETTIFSAGRMVSVVGRVEGVQSGKVGEADYAYPLVSSQQLHLWSRDSGRSRTTFHFGVGVQL